MRPVRESATQPAAAGIAVKKGDASLRFFSCSSFRKSLGAWIFWGVLNHRQSLYSL
jgi:hypothetical protein